MNNTTYIESVTPILKDMQPMPCQSCGMYQYFKISYINSWFHCGFTTFIFTCDNCYEKCTLAQQVIDLQQTISSLNNRITSLINIRNAETSFDKTAMDALTNQFANVNLNHTPQVTINNNTSSADKSEYTSIWVGDTNTNLDTTVLSHAHSSRSLETLFSTINNDSGNNDYFVETGDMSFDKSSASSRSSATNQMLNTKSHVIMEDNLPKVTSGQAKVATGKSGQRLDPNDTTWCTSDGESQLENLNKEVRSTKLEVSEVEALPESIPAPTVVAKPNPDMHIKLIIVGDKGIKNIVLKPQINHKNCFKVSHKSSTIKQSFECVSYLVEKRFKNVEFVLYQVGSDLIKNTESEVLKLQLDHMSKSLQSRDIQLIVSGPAPSTNLRTEAFSRLVAFDKWLMEWAAPEHIVYVSNFDLFWKKNVIYSIEMVH